MELDLDVMGKISVALDNLTSRLDKSDKVQQKIADALTHIPVDRPVSAAGKTNSSGNVVIDLQGPPVGRRWELRRLAVVGPTKGNSYLYAASTAPSTTAIVATGLVDATKTRWPLPAFYSTRQVVVVPSEKLWLVITGATHTTTVQVDGKADTYDWPVAYPITETL